MTPNRRGLSPTPLAMLVLPLLVLGAASRASAQAQSARPDVAVTLTLDAAIARALAANPAQLARALDFGIAGLDVDIARERPNPGFLYENTRDAPHHAFVFTVPMELGSKRARRISVGETARDVVTAELARGAADLRSDVRRAFYRLMAADRRVAFARELATVAGRARDAAKARFESGDAPRLDLVQAELATARVQNATAIAEGERAALEGELDGLIGLPPGTAINVAGDLFADGLDSAGLPTGPVSLPPAAGGGGPVGVNSVDLTAAARRTAAADASIALARSARIPDVTLEGGLTYDAPPDFTTGWKFGGSFTLPLFTTHRVEVARAEQVAAQAVRQQAAVGADVSTRQAAAARRTSALGDAVRRTTRDILPAAATVNDMAQASYESGQTGMVALLQSLQTVAETRLDAVETALAFQLALADLERARGVSQP